MAYNILGGGFKEEAYRANTIQGKSNPSNVAGKLSAAEEQ